MKSKLLLLSALCACGGMEASELGPGSGAPAPSPDAGPPDASTDTCGACAEGSFCDHPGCAPASDEASCRAVPVACGDVWMPVCGCDGQTYGNTCEAHASRVSVEYDGPCVDGCGGIAGASCAATQWCDFDDDSVCGAADRLGVCRPRPIVCGLIADPVCGCDGQSYPNPCEAAAAGTDVAWEGACEEPEPTACGGRLGETCGADAFCDFARDGCDSADATGVCAPRPDGCTLEYRPVCGCDGVTYGNLCAAHVAGVDAARSGPC